MRNVIGVIVGYVIFAASAVVLFQLSGQNPHGAASMQFMLLTVVFGVVFAALGGYVAQRIGSAAWKPAIALAVVIAAGAIASIVASPATDSRWSQWSSVLLMAPASLIGGWLAMRRPRS